MINYKPYFKYLSNINKTVVFMFSAIMVSNIFVSMETALKMDLTENGAIGYTSHPVSAGWMLAFIIGIFYSIMLFSQAMNIKADRAGYLKAAILWGIIISVGVGILGYGLDLIVKFILETKTGNEVEIYSQLMWIDIGSLKASTNLLNRILSNLSIFSIGFVLGAIWYRLKVKYSLIIFVVLPICLGTFVMNYGFRNPDKANELGLSIINTMAFFMQNQGVAIGVKFIGILVCIVFGIRLLIKAPIKDYANDLI